MKIYDLHFQTVCINSWSHQFPRDVILLHKSCDTEKMTRVSLKAVTIETCCPRILLHLQAFHSRIVVFHIIIMETKLKIYKNNDAKLNIQNHLNVKNV